MIKKLYYSVWADLILTIQKKTNKWETNKWYFLFVMSFCFGANYVPLLLLFPDCIYPLKLFREWHVFNSDFLNLLIPSMIIFLLPGYIIHYYLVFYKKKYEQFIKEYESHNGKFIMKYITISLIAPAVLLFIMLIIKWVLY